MDKPCISHTKKNTGVLSKVLISLTSATIAIKHIHLCDTFHRVFMDQMCTTVILIKYQLIF